MDLSKLSDSDLKLMAKGDVRMMSADGLKAIAGQQSNEYEAEAKSQSFMDQVKAGIASGPINLYLGAKQAISGLDDTEKEIVKMNRAAEKAAPISSIAGNVATMLPASLIPGANTIAGASAIGALTGAAQPVMGDESRLTNSVLGGMAGAGGQMAANTVGRVMQPVRSSLNPEQMRLAELAQSKGINLDAAQLSQSKPLQTMKSVMGDMPFTAGREAEKTAAQNAAWNRAIAQTYGANDQFINHETLSAAKSAIGGKFTDLTKRNSLTADNQLLNDLSSIQQNALKYETSDVSRTLGSYMDDLLSKVDQNGVIPGEAYRKMDSAIGKRMAGTTNGDMKNALGELRDTIRSAMDRGISDADKAAWKEARSQYASLKTVEKAMKDDASGNLYPGRLAQQVKGKSGDLPDLARIGTAFIRDNIPNSGTAQRQFWRDFLNGSLLTQGYMLGKGAAGIGAVPIQRAMESEAGKKYLTQGLLDMQPYMPTIKRGALAVPIGLLNSQQE